MSLSFSDEGISHAALKSFEFKRNGPRLSNLNSFRSNGNTSCLIFIVNSNRGPSSRGSSRNALSKSQSELKYILSPTEGEASPNFGQNSLE